MKDEFHAAVREWLAARGDDRQLHRLVIEHKDRGLTQRDAHDVLMHELPNAPDDEMDDRIRDVLDYVVGYCSPGSRIWPDYYNP